VSAVTVNSTGYSTSEAAMRDFRTGGRRRRKLVDPMLGWSIESVGVFLRRLDKQLYPHLEQYVSTFAQFQISGKELVSLTLSDLHDMGVTFAGHSSAILNGVKRRQLQEEQQEQEERAKKARDQAVVTGPAPSRGTGVDNALISSPFPAGRAEHRLTDRDALSPPRVMDVVPGGSVQEVVVHGVKQTVDWVNELKGSTTLEVYTPGKSSQDPDSSSDLSSSSTLIGSSLPCSLYGSHKLLRSS
jgi:hypothetical protein